MDKDWKVFQTDVLDLLNQYRGFFDHFERVGSLSDNSRPDAFARITREEKKEIWVIDAKNKDEIGEEDKRRMEKYIRQVNQNPLDTGLELSELSDHEVKGIFILPENISTEYKVVSFDRLHQFLQKELIYTDTDKIVRDIAKMAERKELTQEQARLLNSSLKPFRSRLEKARDELEKLEEEFVGLKLHTPPYKHLDYSPPTDAVIRHEKRPGTLLIDIPYSMNEAEKAEDNAREIENHIEGKSYYASIHEFEVSSEFACPPKKFREKVEKVFGILSPMKLAEIYTPKFNVEKSYHDGYVELKSSELGFYLKIISKDDVKHRVEASLNNEAVSRMKERSMNSRADFGEFNNDRWTHEAEVTEEREIKYGRTEALEDYKQKVDNIFHSAVNPVYSRKVARKVKKQ